MPAHPMALSESTDAASAKIIPTQTRAPPRALRVLWREAVRVDLFASVAMERITHQSLHERFADDLARARD
jgi:hypothetical protein